jgi:hypothetical protein
MIEQRMKQKWQFIPFSNHIKKEYFDVVVIRFVNSIYLPKR